MQTLSANYSTVILLLISLHFLSVYATTPHQNPRHLAHTALTLSFKRALDTSSYVSRVSSQKPKPASINNAFQDCVRLMSDSATKLKNSIFELQKMGPGITHDKFVMCKSNMQTWVSAALTDQNMCIESLNEGGVVSNGGAVGMRIRKMVADATRVTATALSLVNQIKY